jgi:hypothetical protein
VETALDLKQSLINFLTIKVDSEPQACERIVEPARKEEKRRKTCIEVTPN